MKQKREAGCLRRRMAVLRIVDSFCSSSLLSLVLILLSIDEDGDEVGDGGEPSSGVLTFDESSLIESTSVDSDSASLSMKAVLFLFWYGHTSSMSRQMPSIVIATQNGM